MLLQTLCWKMGLNIKWNPDFSQCKVFLWFLKILFFFDMTWQLFGNFLYVNAIFENYLIFGNKCQCNFGTFSHFKTILRNTVLVLQTIFEHCLKYQFCKNLLMCQDNFDHWIYIHVYTCTYLRIVCFYKAYFEDVLNF